MEDPSTFPTTLFSVVRPCSLWSAHVLCGPPMFSVVRPCSLWSAHVLCGPPMFSVVRPCSLWSAHVQRYQPEVSTRPATPPFTLPHVPSPTPQPMEDLSTFPANIVLCGPP
ncbi:unnamed protein product, partial [Closterium sp. NIES-53]